jgi:diguanylate cyclase (GGDEF)-like protein
VRHREPDPRWRRSRARAGLLFTAAVVIITLIGWCDYITGPAIAFSLFYLVPVAVCGWWAGERLAVLAGLWAALIWLLADIPFRLSEMPIPLWNGATRVAIFVAVAMLTARVRRNTRELEGLNTRLERLLAQESALARTDQLTGLPNARAFREALAAGVARSQRRDEPMCVAYVDVDNFKRVNDAFGHAAGDQVLGRIADVLREELRAGDLPARLGGDEFAVVCWDVPEEVGTAIAERLVAEVRAIAADYPGTGLGASVGLAHFEHPPASIEEVLATADAAMYEAKGRGKGTVAARSAPKAAEG